MRSKIEKFDEYVEFSRNGGKPDKGVTEIDWNEVCREIRSRKTYPTSNAEYWDKRAPSFARNSSKSDYISKFLKLVELKRDWTVLDVGCAAGTLAIPWQKRLN